MPAFTPGEWGMPKAPPAAPKPDGQPRGDAMMPIPHPLQFGGTAGWSGRAYWNQHDEATAHSRENAERIRLDPVIDACMRLRTYPTSLLSHHIDPDDDEDDIQVKAAAAAQKVLAYLPGFLFAKHHLLDDGTFTGRSGCFARWGKVYKRGRVWDVPTGFRPVGGDKLVFLWDGRVGVLVQGTFPGPTIPVPAGGGRAYVLSDEDREQMITYKFEPTDASYWMPQRAGAINGLGLRDKLYWLWALKMRVWGMGMDFLQWFARGLTVYYFRNGNAEHANAVRRWVEAQDGSSAMLFPWFNANEPNFKPIERFEASTASPQFLQTLITDYFDRLFKEIILGQTLTSGTAPTGLGSGVAAAHQTTFDQIVKYDATALGECLTECLLAPFYRANFPGVPCGRFVFDLDDPNAQSMLENAQLLYQMGAAIPEEPLLEAGGLPRVKPGQTILTNIQGMQPAAADGTPTGVPVVQGEPVRMSMRQWAEVCRLSRNGDRRAQKLLRTRRVEVKGLAA